MRRRIPRAIGVCTSAVALCFATEEPERVNVRDLRLPLQHYADGRVRLELKAAAAHVPLSGPIRAWNARLDLYDQTGAIEATIEADNLRYDRSTGVVRSKSEVRARRANITLTGTGFEWVAAENIVRVFEDVRVVFQRPSEKEKE